MHENDRNIDENVNEIPHHDDNINDGTDIAETNSESDVSSDTAESPVPTEVKPENKPPLLENGKWKFFYPAVVLTAISVIVALLLSVLNAFTAQVIADRKTEEKNNAIKELFGNISPPQTLEMPFEQPVNEVMKVYSASGTFLGYCVSISPKGFSGKIDMLAAIDTNGEIIQVKILDMSETAGIGTKVTEDYFLEQFVRKKQGITANSDSDNSIDTISGATISANAVLKGINAALEAVNSIGIDSVIPETSESAVGEETTLDLPEMETDPRRNDTDDETEGGQE